MFKTRKNLHTSNNNACSIQGENIRECVNLIFIFAVTEEGEVVPDVCMCFVHFVFIYSWSPT